MLAYQQHLAFDMKMLQADSLHIMRSNKEVLSGVNFHVDPGEVYALLGGNGAGKSTTLLSFLGFLTPTKGQVLVNGSDAVKNITATRRAIAYLPESASLYEHLTPLENLAYFLGLANVNVTPSEIERVLDRVALSQEARTKKLEGFSKGMRQKVAIALAMLRDSDILLLDEPTSGLDPSAIDEFHRIIRELADTGKTILMVTHDVYGACQVANRIGLLRDGRLVGQFSAENKQRIDTETVHKAFSLKSDSNSQRST